MWYPSTITVAPTAEPVTLADAQAQCFAPEDEFKATLERLIRSARAHAEVYCNARFAEQTIASECDGFVDFVRLPEAPLKSVTSISYVDAAGDAQTVDGAVFEPHKDGLEPSIGLKPGQAWPRIRVGSRITLTAVYGGSVPDDVKHAMLLFIDDAFNNRANAERDDWTALDALLCNHRRGA